MTRFGADDVSVVVPVFNCERYVAEALESIFEQSALPGEIIVVDDGSDDNTLQVVGRFGDSIRVITQPNSGIAVARNVGINAATRELLSFLDADDLMAPGSLQRRLDRLGEDDQPDAVSGRIIQFVSPDVDPERAARFRFLEGPQAANLFPTMVMRREVFERAGPLDDSFASGSEIDWISRARIAGVRFTEIDDVVLMRRIHGQNHSTRMGIKKNAELLRVVNAHRQRNRRSVEDASS
jgi:glycosyltransferase involved in cell wall biosynthesis